MNKLYYYNANGKKFGPVTVAEFMQLAQEGVVTPDTLLETDCGYVGLAGKSSSISFDAPLSHDQLVSDNMSVECQQNT